MDTNSNTFYLELIIVERYYTFLNDTQEKFTITFHDQVHWVDQLGNVSWKFFSPNALLFF